MLTEFEDDASGLPDVAPFDYMHTREDKNEQFDDVRAA